MKALVLRAERLYLAESTLGLSETSSIGCHFPAYSPKCPEGEFCELRHNGVLRSSGSYRGALQRKEGDVVLLLPSLSNEGVELLHEEAHQRPLVAASGDERP